MKNKTSQTTNQKISNTYFNDLCSLLNEDLFINNNTPNRSKSFYKEYNSYRCKPNNTIAQRYNLPRYLWSKCYNNKTPDSNLYILVLTRLMHVSSMESFLISLKLLESSVPILMTITQITLQPYLEKYLKFSAIIVAPCIQKFNNSTCISKKITTFTITLQQPNKLDLQNFD